MWMNKVAGLAIGLALCAPASLWAGAQAEKPTLEILHGLNAPTDGYGAAAHLVLADDGRFYGVNSGDGMFDAGTLFSVDKHGQFSVVHSFNPWTEDVTPMGRLVAAPDGWLYGVSDGVGCGALYRVNRASGAYERLHVFVRETGGCDPKGLVQDRHGAFYGTTANGGSHDLGTVFRWDPLHGIDVLHHFGQSGGDGAYLLHAPTLSHDHATLYGVTYRGGASDAGTVFRVKTDGTGYQVLHAFGGDTGERPSGELLAAKDGSFYGLTGNGGAGGGHGTLYRLSADGQVTVRHTFKSFSAEGEFAAGRLTEGEHGLLYGTTTYGGPNASGTLFTLSRTGSLTILHAFDADDPEVGYNARGGLVKAHGYLYGATGNRYPYATAGAIFRIRKLPPEAAK